MWRVLIGVLLLAVLAGEAVGARADEARILVFTATAGFRHDSIPDAVAAVRRLGAQHGFGVDATEDAQSFSDANLARYQAVVFLCTTGELLDDDQRAAFQRFIEAGHGYVGVHSASDTGDDWAWYGGLVGAYFANHPSIQPALLRVEMARMRRPSACRQRGCPPTSGMTFAAIRATSMVCTSW